MCNGPVQQQPGTQATLLPPTQNYGQFSGSRPWTSIPFMQTYGGHAAPWADQNSQILNEWNGQQMGAGRFNANNAARYGFAGPWQWQPDTRQDGGGLMPQGPGGGGMAQAGGPSGGGYSLRGGSDYMTNGPGAGGMAQAGGPNMGIPSGPGYSLTGDTQKSAVDPMAGFQDLLKQDPRAASEALNFNPGWFQKNQGALAGMVPGGDVGAWRNQTQPQMSNVGAITDEQRALIRQKMGW